MTRVLVTGGAGYVGAVLVPRLLEWGHTVRVLDWMFFGDDVFDAIKDRSRLEVVAGDLRDGPLVASCVAGCDAVIHLACISNDPSFELDPKLGRSVNLDPFRPLVRHAQEAGVRRFIYASSSSVYGVSDAKDVDEEHPLRPLTDYSRYKAQCEDILLEESQPGFEPVIVRPATVCGDSPRLRLDLTVNILTSHAYHRGKITVFGGQQLRPSIHIDDLCDLYLQLLDEPASRVSGNTFNAGYQNHTVLDIASIVAGVVRQQCGGREVSIETTPSNDQRSYHISSRYILENLGFRPRRTIENAAAELVAAFEAGRVSDPEDNRYHNVRLLQERGAPTFSAAPATKVET